MSLSATAVPLQEILPWREQFRREAPGQIVHDSLHGRPGWTLSYLLAAGETAAGYGTVAVGGPWSGTRTVFEFHLATEQRWQAAALFDIFLRTSAASHFEFQTSHNLLAELAPPRAGNLNVERIVFREGPATALPAPAGAVFHRAAPGDSVRTFAHHVEPVGNWVIEMDGVIAATGGMLSHYNPPHRDLFMEVAEPYRRRGLGSWLLQELKRTCRADGGLPCARCAPDKFASHRCLTKAGFVPWTKIVTGPVAPG